MIELNFYKQPFRKGKYNSWVYDAENNFVFEFEPKLTKGNYADGEEELMAKVVESLNAKDREPVAGLVLNQNPGSTIELLRNEELFILIRGWGNLTGIGGHNFSADKAAKIQDDFANWLLWRLCENATTSK